MSQNKLEELRRQLQQLRIVTSRLQSENNTLRERVNRLELKIQPDHNVEIEPDYNVGDRIRILNPTCPGRNRQIIPQEGIVSITRVTDDWIYFTCDSGVKTKRYRKNIRKLA